MPAPKRSVLPSGDVRLDGERCSASVQVLAPRVTLTKYAGHLDAETCVGALAESERLAGSGAVFSLFIDASEMASYDTRARVEATEWLKSRGDRIATTHILQGSKIVAMGIAVVNLAIGGKMQVHSSRASFEAALRASGVPMDRSMR